MVDTAFGLLTDALPRPAPQCLLPSLLRRAHPVHGRRRGAAWLRSHVSAPEAALPAGRSSGPQHNSWAQTFQHLHLGVVFDQVLHEHGDKAVRFQCPCHPHQDQHGCDEMAGDQVWGLQLRGRPCGEQGHQGAPQTLQMHAAPERGRPCSTASLTDMASSCACDSCSAVCNGKIQRHTKQATSCVLDTQWTAQYMR